jgi:hypothetical protein
MANPVPAPAPVFQTVWALQDPIYLGSMSVARVGSIQNDLAPAAYCTSAPQVGAQRYVIQVLRLGFSVFYTEMWFPGVGWTPFTMAAPPFPVMYLEVGQIPLANIPMAFVATNRLHHGNRVVPPIAMIPVIPIPWIGVDGLANIGPSSRFIIHRPGIPGNPPPGNQAGDILYQQHRPRTPGQLELVPQQNNNTWIAGSTLRLGGQLQNYRRLSN